MLRVWPKIRNPPPVIIVPIKTIMREPNRSTAQPASGPVGPLSERARENMKDTVAKLAPKYACTGRMKTGKPLFTAVLLMDAMMAHRATIHQP